MKSEAAALSGQTDGGGSAPAAAVLLLRGDLPGSDPGDADRREDGAAEQHPAGELAKHPQEGLRHRRRALQEPRGYGRAPPAPRSAIPSLHSETLTPVPSDDDGNNQWPEVLKFLFDSVNSEDVGLREAALHVFW